MVHLKIAQKRLRTFVDILDNYEIVPAAEKELCEKTLDIKDPAKRRGLKIKQYQKEKELRARIEVRLILFIIYLLIFMIIQVIRKRRGQQFVPEVDPTDFALITSLLPSPSSTSSVDDEDEDDSETDDILREATLLLLRLTYTQARGQLEGTDQELELLRSAPPSPSSSVPTLEKGKGKSRDEGDMWKLEVPARSNGGGPLLDLSGKVCSQLNSSILVSFIESAGSLFNHSQFSPPGPPIGHGFNPKYLVLVIVYRQCL